MITETKTLLLGFSEDSSGELICVVGVKPMFGDVSPINIIYGQEADNIYKQLTGSKLNLPKRG